VDILLSAAHREHFKQVLETRIAESDHALAAAEHEAREGAVKHAETRRIRRRANTNGNLSSTKRQPPGRC
jgi:hypothetical protein